MTVNDNTLTRIAIATVVVLPITVFLAWLGAFSALPEEIRPPVMALVCGSAILADLTAAVRLSWRWFAVAALWGLAFLIMVVVHR